MKSRQFVPELFEPNGGLGIAVCPEQCNHFAESSDLAWVIQRRNPRLDDGIAYRALEPRGIWPAINHETSESFPGVELNQAALPQANRNVKAPRVQTLDQAVA